MILRNGKFSGKILRKIFWKIFRTRKFSIENFLWKIFRTRKFSMENFPPHITVHTSSEAHPVSYPMGTGGLFLGGKALPGRDADHSPPSGVEVKNELNL
jgi:hypothetical protein